MTRTPSAYQRSVAAIACAAMLSLSCKTTPSPQAPRPAGDVAFSQDAPPGLDLRLSNGRAGAPAVDRATLAPASKLGDADTDSLFARVKALAAAPEDKKAFALRARSLPPPRTGETVKGAFPPADSGAGAPPAEAGKSLEVLRWAPEGDVPIAPSLSITFSQPMVAVTSQDDAAATVPVKLTPTPRGKWRWLGTRTLLFDPDVRFPQATTYKVEVPAGVKSATGGTLAAGKTFSFTTPAPRVVGSAPSGGPTRLTPGIFILFDQKIDPAAVLPHVKVVAGKRTFKVERLDDAAIAKDDEVSASVASARAAEQDGRWLAVRPTDALPTDTEVTVTVEAGTPSAEGPNPIRAAQSFSFHTYPPLRIERAECGWNGQCPPGMPFNISFNNPLDTKRFDRSLISVSPELPGLVVTPGGSEIAITGQTRAATRYQVTLSRAIVDRFGQTLERNANLSFQVGHADPNFVAPSGMIVLDPAAKAPRLDLFLTNFDAVKVKLYQVTPRDWPAYTEYLRHQWDNKKHPVPPGKKVFDQAVKTGAAKDVMTEVSLDLAPALKGGLGHVIAMVEPSPWKSDGDPPREIVWVQSTRLAVDAFVDGEDLVGWTTRLTDGKPVSGARLEIAPTGATASTDDTGTARIPLAEGKRGGALLIAKAGDDTAFIPDDQSMWDESGSWLRQKAGDELRWYVTDDRAMYRPGETVHVKGWLRRVGGGKGGDVAGLAGQVASVRYDVLDPTGNSIGKGTAPVSLVGGFDLSLKLPSTPNLGYAQLHLEATGRIAGAITHGFQIQEFRRPEFEVTTTASEGPHLVGRGIDVTAQAHYYAGGGLPAAPVSWSVTAERTSYTPPGRDDFTFGIWKPWWGEGGWWGKRGSDEAEGNWSFQGVTDAGGDHVLHLDPRSSNPALPMSVTASASVQDVNRQAWSSSTALLIHPATRYVGVRAKKPYVDKGQPIELEVIGVDLDGKATVGVPIELRAVRLDWSFEDGEVITKEVDAQTCKVTAAAAPSACAFRTDNGGTYRIAATIRDDKGRPNLTQLTVFVSGGTTPPSRNVEQQEVSLIPDQHEYRGGDTAELLVQAPFFPAEGILSVRRSGLVKYERFQVDGPTAKVKVPIVDGYVPNVTVQVDLVGAARRTDDAGHVNDKLPPRPAYARGSIDLPVPPRARTLAVEVTPKDLKVAPGAKTRIDVAVKDASGKGVDGAEVAVIVVDEAILALTSKTFDSPLGTFYAQRSADVRDYSLRGKLALSHTEEEGVIAGVRGGAAGGAVVGTSAMAVPMPAAPPMAEMADASPRRMMAKSAAPGSAPAPAIAVRSNFDPLAAFAPAVMTKGGRATVELTIPDNLTRYRVVALAVSGERDFGKGESAVVARMPMMVRPSAPRFLNFGDTFELPVVVQNQTDAALTVDVAVRATNAAITDGRGRKVTVPANDRVEVRFPAAAEMPGTARFQIVAASGSFSDAAEVALPVWTPATTEAFATYGVIDSGAMRQPVALPGKVWPQFGGLEVETSSTQLQALTDAFLYLVTYRFECSEQLSSRILAIAALRDVLAAFQVASMPSAADIEARIRGDLERLASMQNDDGGFGLWKRGDETWPFNSVHVVHALAIAKAKGYPVDKEPLERGLAYLKDIERHYPSYYPAEVRRAITAYALHVRKLLGDRDVVRARGLVAEAGGVDKLPIEAAGWLLSVFAGDPGSSNDRAALLRHLDNKAVETAGAANWTTSYGDGTYLLLGSDRRADGVILDALIDEKPSSDLIPKAVAGLLGQRTRGRWDNTQDNVFALLALDKYFHTFEKTTPSFVARVWLGTGYAGDHAFRGRTTERHQIDIPMSALVTLQKGDLTIQKDGAGRLYYRIGMTYAPSDLTPKPADHGFVVERRYEAVDDPKDVVRNPDGSWTMKAGARVRVRVTMVAESRRYHVALVDPLPAGLEPMNPALAVTGNIPKDPKDKTQPYWWWMSTWYEHQNLRDERAEAFASLLWEGVHEYTYVARATTPGRYVVPPPKAEEMYAPETFGRGAGDRVVVR